MQWTEDQKRVIEFRGNHLLVAAAAGSGKTAVLVEHVLSQIQDPVDPLNVNELLIVTFTRAAAAEMKERLRSRMEDLLTMDPSASYLHRQISLLDQAHICTIDSFCQWLVKNYFHYLDLDPDFRILDEGEATLMKEDVLDRMMERHYQEKNPDFLHFMDAYASGKGDKTVREMIQRLYRFSDSAPWPDAWMREACEGPAAPKSLTDYAWASELMEEIRQDLHVLYEMTGMAQQICLRQKWLAKYETMFNSDLRELRNCLEADTLPVLLTCLERIEFVKKPTIPKKIIEDIGQKDALSALRDIVKDECKKLQKKFCLGSESDMILHIENSMHDCRELVSLTTEFRACYQKVKKERNAAEFADVEHWALDLLMRRDDHGEHYTELADQLSLQFREIIIDEYQDSNLIQEKLLTALSTDRIGRPNMFMVGDVKQSIYKFRMAKPELFMDKYRRFSEHVDGEAGCKIDLSKNFRSRKTVLDEANRLFYEIMGEKLGGVAYDDKAALYAGADYRGEDPSVELLITENSSGEIEAPEAEAHRVAERIRELMNPAQPYQVWDGKAGSFRSLEYRDIVILLRSLEGWAEEMAGILNQEGIPAYTQLKKGYFKAGEVQILLNFLKILDNPRQDIPLASVMHSPIGGFSEEEMAEMCAGQIGEDFYERCKLGAEGGICTEKWNRLMELITRYRKEAIHLTIAELLSRVLTETDYRLILAASPDGAVRLANVEMLMEKARDFEKTVYHGIFHFLRYMEKIRTYEMDFGEAQVLSEHENLVRITSIHKSKGLEYPVVFVAGMAKNFNLMDANAGIQIQEELGIAAADIDTNQRTRCMTLTRQRIAACQRRETRGEELRVLYVAMTRAKEKLILTAAVTDRKKLDEYMMVGEVLRRTRQELGMEKGSLPGLLLNRAGSYLDWLAMAGMLESQGKYQVDVQGELSLVEKEAVRMGEEEMLRRNWLAGDFTQEPNRELWNRLEAMKNYSYPWEKDIRRKSVVSVSELKHQSAEHFLAQQDGIILERASYDEPVKDAEDVQQRDITHEEQNTSLKDVWQTESGGPSLGALRGTAYHLVFEKTPCEVGADAEQMKRQLDRMVSEGMISEEIRPMLRVRDFTAFYRSDLGRRMAAAEKEDRLYKEQPFVMGIPDGDDFLLVQGIIDAFMEEDGDLILWDYKTDRVPERDPEGYLVGLYREQLCRYRDALEQGRGQKVREIWIYSVTMGKMIAVD